MRGIQIKSKPHEIADGFHGNFIGATAENGDRATGQVVKDAGRTLFVYADANGAEYESPEMPAIRW